MVTAAKALVSIRCAARHAANSSIRNARIVPHILCIERHCWERANQSAGSPMLAAFAIMCISREESAADLVIPRVRTPDIVTLPTIELRAPVSAKVRHRCEFGVGSGRRSA
jgi:hypothetical protein